MRTCWTCKENQRNILFKSETMTSDVTSHGIQRHQTSRDQFANKS